MRCVLGDRDDDQRIPACWFLYISRSLYLHYFYSRPVCWFSVSRSFIGESSRRSDSWRHRREAVTRRCTCCRWRVQNGLSSGHRLAAVTVCGAMCGRSDGVRCYVRQVRRCTVLCAACPTVCGAMCDRSDGVQCYVRQVRRCAVLCAAGPTVCSAMCGRSDGVQCYVRHVRRCAVLCAAGPTVCSAMCGMSDAGGEFTVELSDRRTETYIDNT